MRAFWSALAVIMAGGASAAEAACEPVIESGRILPATAYDPFTPSPTTIPMEVPIRNNGQDACTVHLTMSTQAGGRFMRGRAPIAYDIVTPTGQILRNVAEASYGVPVLVPAKATVPVSLLIRLPAGQIVPSGPYHDQLSLRLFAKPGEPIGRETHLPATISVSSLAQISLSGTNSPFGSGLAVPTLDFGVLAEGAERRAYLQLRSNGRARISINSENKGRLANVQLGPDAVIPYALTIDGQAVQLNKGPVKLSRRPALTLDGANYDLVARIGTFVNRFAGVYRDTITISVDPEE